MWLITMHEWVQIYLNLEKPEQTMSKLKQWAKLNDKIQFQSGDKAIHVACSMKNLGVYYDVSLDVKRQLNAISRACYYHTCNIARLR